jgi:L-rhamnose mutarotase
MADATISPVVAGTRPAPRARVGVFGIGLEAYWDQFDGLRDRIEGYQQRVEARVGELGADVVSAGLVDTAPKAREAGDRFAAAQVDLVLCHAVTYATSSQVLPALQAAGVPVVLLGLQPTPTLDYANTDTGEWLANCAACCVPEIAGACTRARIPYDTVAGTIDDDERAWARIAAWVRAAGAARALRRARIGFLGHTYPGMLDLYTDFTVVHAQTGAHVEVLEIDDLAARVAQVTGDEVAAKEAEIRESFTFADPSGDPIAGPIADDQLAWSARVAAGLDRLAGDFDLDGLTYYYRGLAATRPSARAPASSSATRCSPRGDPDRGRGRPQDERRADPARPPRRGRLLHGVVRHRLRRGFSSWATTGPRTSRSPGPPDPARAEGLPRQARRRAQRRDEGALRPGDHRRLHPDARGPPEAHRRRGGVGPRPDDADRQHELAADLRPAARGVLRALVRGGAHPSRRARRRPPPRGAAPDRPAPRARLGAGGELTMERVLFVLHVRPDRLEEYKRRHREVWPEMLDALREAGWRNYSLFLRPDGMLVGYVECEDFAAAQAAMAATAVNDRWQESMLEFFDARADHGLERLEEVFHLA